MSNRRNTNFVVDKIINKNRYDCIFIPRISDYEGHTASHDMTLFESKMDAEAWISDDVKYELDMLNMNRSAKYEYQVTHRGEHPQLTIVRDGDLRITIDYHLMKAPVKNTWKHRSSI